ncbi:hypothetical protein ACFLWS_03615 [Chloroflexota bacterium]
MKIHKLSLGVCNCYLLKQHGLILIINIFNLFHIELLAVSVS